MSDHFSFGEALYRLKQGAKLQRHGWNGKGMYVCLKHGYPEGVPANKAMTRSTGIPEGTVIKFMPYLMLKAADDSFIPWTPSQSDVLAEDWQVVP